MNVGMVRWSSLPSLFTDWFRPVHRRIPCVFWELVLELPLLHVCACLPGVDVLRTISPYVTLSASPWMSIRDTRQEHNLLTCGTTGEAQRFPCNQIYPPKVHGRAQRFDRNRRSSRVVIWITIIYEGRFKSSMRTFIFRGCGALLWSMMHRQCMGGIFHLLILPHGPANGVDSQTLISPGRGAINCGRLVPTANFPRLLPPWFPPPVASCPSWLISLPSTTTNPLPVTMPPTSNLIFQINF